jgi:hypothetical protein
VPHAARAASATLIDALSHRSFRFHETMFESSRDWKTGRYRENRTVLSDITHGRRFAESVLSAYSDNPNELRAGLILGYDDLELLNSLGVVRGKKKMACFYVSLANFDALQRFEFANMCVLMLVLEKVLKRCGAVRVVSGADSITGEVDPKDWASFGNQVRESMAGNIRIRVSTSPASPPASPSRLPPRRLQPTTNLPHLGELFGWWDG